MSQETKPQPSIQLIEITSAVPASLQAEARALLLEYGRFVVTRPGAARFCFGTLEKEAEYLPESYLKQGGGCLLARVDLSPLGFVAWRDAPATARRGSWELKRLWVSPSARGLGLGRTLTQAVLDRAVAAHRSAVYLDTIPSDMTAAHRLYLAMGFAPCAPYNDNPVTGLAYLVKSLHSSELRNPARQRIENSSARIASPRSERDS